MSSKKSFRDYQLATKKDIKFINNNYNILHLSAKNYLKYFPSSSLCLLILINALSRIFNAVRYETPIFSFI